MAVAILLLTTIFVATTGDSMSYTISMVSTGHDTPAPRIRAFWGIAMAGMAAVLLYRGEGQISALQQFIVITAIPVSLVVLPSLWLGPQTAYTMARTQGLLAEPAPANRWLGLPLGQPEPPSAAAKQRGRHPSPRRRVPPPPLRPGNPVGRGAPRPGWTGT